MHILIAAVSAAALSLAGCSAAAPQAPTAPSHDSACEVAFAVASDSVDADSVQAALEDAIGACETAEDWARASQEHARGLEGVDPQQFLVDRCLNGPPDIADSTLCQATEVDR